MTSWLEPAPSAARSDEFIEEPDFASGIEDEVPVAEVVSEEGDEGEVAELEAVETDAVEVEVEAVEVETVEVPAEAFVSDDDDDGFASGLEDVPAPVAKAPAPQPKRAEPPRVEAPKPVVQAPAEDDEFGAGITDVELPPTRRAEPRRPVESVAPEGPEATTVSSEVAEAIDAIEGGDAVAPIEVAEPEAKKPRTRRKKAEDAAEDTSESKPKPRTRRPKKKEGEGEADGDVSDDKPKYMGGAERRTAAGDDEGEIKPFFDDGGTADFDPDAPNDRFANASRSDEGGEVAEDAEPVERFSDDVEPAEAAEQEARDFAHEAEEPAEAEVTGRGFNDDFDSGPRRDNDRGRGGRGDRDRGRGGSRGGRDDRGRGGPRGDRDRGPDRGPRGAGGFKGGPGGPKGGRDRGLPKPPIQEIFKRGQEVIVQVIKEAVGTKGPTLSTYVSIAGRYLVLMPSLNRVGVSRKIEDHDARRRLREIMTTLAPPKGVGFIVRTAAVDRDAKELQNDLAYLLRLWQVVVKRLKRVAGPVEIYRESDMITRTIRDIFTSDIDTIWVDEATAYGHASEFLQIVMPKFANRIKHFDHTEPLFHRYAIEDEIAKIHQKRIEMPLGGSLVIEQTEALVAIDVNSGNFRADNNAEETAFQMNLHAAKEIARQLRLRDLGGVIVNDFIDMRSESHRRKVEDAFREALRRDRARTKILRISQFGLIEMTRQRIRPSLKRSIFSDCPHCRSNGFVKTSESLAIEVMRLLHLAAHRAPAVQVVQVGVHVDAANYLLNKRRKEIAALEERGKLEVQITGQPGVSPDLMSVRCFDHNGNEVRLLPPAPLPKLTAGRVPPRDDRGRGGRDDRGGRYPRPLD